jgi:hypothetical protein
MGKKSVKQFPVLKNGNNTMNIPLGRKIRGSCA